MEVLKETKEFTLYKKRSGRYAVKGKDGKWINGQEKIKILMAEGIAKGGLAKPKTESSEETADKAEEKPTEEKPAEESQE